jgi:HEAT repeat protein
MTSSRSISSSHCTTTRPSPGVATTVSAGVVIGAFGALLAIAVTTFPHALAAQARGPKPPALSASARAEIDQAEHLLKSDRREDVEVGIQSLGLLGVPQAVDPLVTRIREGLPPELLELAVTTLLALGQPNAGPALYELTSHRRSAIRRHAIEAIAATRPADSEPVLLTALSDEDSEVRSAAAIALGEVGSPRAVDRLLLALNRGNSEASIAIGKLVAPKSVRKLSAYLGEVPFHHMGPALAVVIARRDVPDSEKLELIARLQEVGTAEVRGYLGNLLETSGDALSPAVKRAVERAIQQIGD